MIPLSLFSVNIVSEYLLLLVSLLVFIAIMIIKVGAKLGMPSLLLFLILGMLVGRGGLGLRFDDIESAESLGHFAITIILFTGGLETSLSESRPIMKHGSVLSTLGVFLTALLTGVFTYLVVGKHIGAIGSSLLGCLLLASVMGSTDSASVFSVLRGIPVDGRNDSFAFLDRCRNPGGPGCHRSVGGIGCGLWCQVCP